MRIFLFGISSFSYWLMARMRPAGSCAVGSSALKSCVPNRAAIEYLEALFPHIPQPYHVLVPNRRRSSVPEAVAHVSIYSYREKPFARIGNGVFASCPELCFVQLATMLPLYELVKAGDALCGTFFVDPDANGNLGSRTPITSKRRIEAFLRRNPGLRGVKAARSALRFMVDGAASPPEAFLWSVLSTSQRHGGFAIPGLVMNKRIRPSKKARRIARRETLVPDLSHSASRLAIEYDSNSEHLGAIQITRDSSKRLALEADGFKVITVTTRQLADPASMRDVAGQAAKRIGYRMRIRSKNFDQSQRALYAAGWSLDGYHRQSEPDETRPAGYGLRS